MSLSLNYDSGSDESIENMKLDLLKAKYAHQKLKVNNNNFQSNHKAIATGKDKPQNTDNFFKNRNTSRDQLHPKSSNIPSLSKRNSSSNKHTVINEKKVENNYEESEEEVEEEEDGDISKINDYVDYLLNKNKLSINEDVSNDYVSNPFQKHVQTENHINGSEAYQKCNRDFIVNTESTDILAQWRLRRKMNEAQNSVKIEHQRHHMHIYSLKHQMNDVSQSNSVSPYNYIPNCSSSFISRKMVESVSINDDHVPVREFLKNDKPDSPITVVKDINGIRTTSDAYCQCQLNQSKFLKVDQQIQTKNTKRIRYRNVAIMTQMRSAHTSKLIDQSTQTQIDNIQSSSSNIVNRSSEWDDRNVCHDYIDRAIEKTLQSQLFDRNYSPSISTITSIHELQNVDAIVPMNSQSFYKENNNNNKNIVNNDLFSDDLPWNDKFEIDSENEFQHDNVLIDLRKRRQANLKMLQKLSEKIRNYKTSHLAPIESQITC